MGSNHIRRLIGRLGAALALFASSYSAFAFPVNSVYFGTAPGVPLPPGSTYYERHYYGEVGDGAEPARLSFIVPADFSAPLPIPWDLTLVNSDDSTLNLRLVGGEDFADYEIVVWLNFYEKSTYPAYPSNNYILQTPGAQDVTFSFFGLNALPNPRTGEWDVHLYVTNVPEPHTIILMLLGLGAVSIARARCR